ncbi:MAG: hypothetical protein K8W52_42135 [Deltaproteobacteria bacterium]|nr:hypothetical protein [Deltaproteobacteria bacterium]
MSLRVPMTDLDERDELSCAHNAFLEVYYQDQRFTGIGYEERADAIDEYAYVDGFGHGRCTTTARDGQLLEEFFLARGYPTGEERQWDRDGQLRSYRHHGAPALTRHWSAAGALIEERTATTLVRWFADGGLRYRRIDDTAEVFVQSGARALIHRPTRAVPPRTYDGYEFDDAVMDAHLEALAGDRATEHQAFLWTHALLHRDRARATAALARLLAHPSLWIVTTTMRLVGNSQLTALAAPIRAYADDDRVPPHERDASGGRMASHSLASVARAVLAQLAA